MITYSFSIDGAILQQCSQSVLHNVFFPTIHKSITFMDEDCFLFPYLDTKKVQMLEKKLCYNDANPRCKFGHNLSANIGNGASAQWSNSDINKAHYNLFQPKHQRFQTCSLTNCAFHWCKNGNAFIFCVLKLWSLFGQYPVPITLKLMGGVSYDEQCCLCMSF